MFMMTIKGSLFRFITIFLFILMVISLPFLKAQTIEFMPLNQIKAGDKGFGLTVFKGEEPEKFDFEVIGTQNSGEGSHYIWVLLSGGPKDSDGIEILKKTNIMHGMSGSPLFIDTKIIGVISASPDLSKEAYAIATPIEYMSGFKPDAASLPNKFLTDAKTIEPIHLSVGQMYAFCDYWGSERSCKAGTISLFDSTNKLFYALGHQANPVGVEGLPIFRAKVLASLPLLSGSTKIAESIGPIIGTAIYESPFVQISKVGVLPKFFEMRLSLENYFMPQRDYQYYFAYVPATSVNVLSVIAGKKDIVDKSLAMDAEIRIDAIGLKQVYSYGELGEKYLKSILDMLITDNLDTVIENIRVALKVRPKYNVLGLQKIKSEFKKDPDGKLIGNITVIASGDNEWTGGFSLTLDKKYLDKELYISNGEELAVKMLPQLKRGEQAVDLLNRVSDRNALYVYYFDSESVKNEKSLQSTPAIIISKTANFLMSAETPKANAVNPVKGWTSQSRNYDWDILAKIKPPDDNNFINGEKSFTVKLLDTTKDKKSINKNKKFLIF